MKKTKTERILLFILILLVITVTILSILLVTKKKEGKHDNKINIFINKENTIHKKINIRNLDEKEIKEYELIINNNAKKL